MTARTQGIRVLCVDDHPIVRDGIASAISDTADMVVIGEAATGEEAVALYKQHRPDITMMDLRLRGMSGLDAIRAIHQYQVDSRIIVLTMYEGDEDIHRALAAGAVAYLLKDTLSDDLLRVARFYLERDNRNTGTLIALPRPAGAEPPETLPAGPIH